MSRLVVKNGRLYRQLGMGSVQSTPRVMRGAPAPRGRLVDVQLSERGLAGLSLRSGYKPSNAPAASDAAAAPTKLSPRSGSLKQDTTADTKAPAAAAAPTKLSPQLLIIGAICVGVGAIYFLRRKRK